MQSKFEKVVAGLKTGPRFLKELREFDNLVKAIGECKSKAEEDRIIVAELELLKQRLSDPKLDKSRGKEYMIRLIYCEMLGHDASFAYIKALQFASDPNIHTKKAAYLALTQFLDCNNQLVLLLVNTLLSDLKSDNYLIVCTALIASTRLIGGDLVSAVLPVVVERLRHPKDAVRKKAVMALHAFAALDPRREGALAGIEVERHFRTMLCDKDPSVMSAALCALHDCVRADPRSYKNLIPSFTSILKQVSEHRLPKTYDYHRFPAPFIQIKLLKILAALGAGDRAASDNMAAVLGSTLRRANGSHTIGSALVAECCRTITTIYPNPQLLAAAAESIGAFLRSPSHNLRYVGIDCLAGIAGLNPAVAAEHQVAVLDCLEDPDDTLKLKTLELLYRMTKANNAQVIVDKMMGYLATVSDDHVRRDIVRKVSDLAERYAPSPAWFVSTLTAVFRLGGEHVDEGAAHGLVRLIAEQDAALHASAVEAYLALLDGAAGGPGAGGGGAQAAAAGPGPGGGAAGRSGRLPETILLVICWVLGEYGHLARRPPGAVLGALVGLLGDAKAATPRVRAALLSALSKLAAHTGGAGGPVGAALLAPGGSTPASAFLRSSAASADLDLAQRAAEVEGLLGLGPALLAAALPADAAAEDLGGPGSDVGALPFLDGLVGAALQAGAAPYLPPEARAAKAGTAGKGLRFEAYEPAPYAMPLASSSSSLYGGGGGGDGRAGPSGVAPSGGSASSASAAAAGGPSTSGPSSAAAAAAAAAPQLVVKGGGRRWGPAQYEADSPAAPAPPSTSAPAQQPAQQPQRGGGGHSRNASASAAPLTGAAAERERLAASIFGGPAAAAPPPTQQQQQQARGAAAAAGRPAVGTGGPGARGPPPAAAAAPPAPPASAVDLLMDLHVPSPQHLQHQQHLHQQQHLQQQQLPGGPAARGPGGGGGGGDWMDSLMGGPVGGPVGGLGPPNGGGPGPALGGMHGGPPGGAYGMPLHQQQQQQPAMMYGGVVYGGGGALPMQAPPGGMAGGLPQQRPQGGPGMPVGYGGPPPHLQQQQQWQVPAPGMGGLPAQQPPPRQQHAAPDAFVDLLG